MSLDACNINRKPRAVVDRFKIAEFLESIVRLANCIHKLWLIPHISINLLII